MSAVIAGFGLVTAVGVTAKETAASVRSATARFTETAIHDRRFEPVTLATVPDDALPPLVPAVDQMPGLTSRMRRMLRLATSALREATATLPARAPRPGLILAVPETETTIPFDGKRFLTALSAQVGDVFDVTYSVATNVGRAGGLVAIGHAAGVVAEGRTPLMLAGGVDTYRDLYVLATMDKDQRLKSASNLDGFIPGEGASFLLLANATRAADLGLAGLARMSLVAEGHEAGHLYSEEVYRGDGLAATLRTLFSIAPLEAPVLDVYSAMNGESHWAKEWSVAYLRNRAAFSEGFRVHHPADCYGDLGAAAGPALIALALLGIGGGYRAPAGIVYCSSDRGQRAAMLISAA